jgi:hypothetical protein
MFSIMTIASSTTKPVPMVSHQRQVVERKAAEPHHAMWATIERQRDTGDDGGANGAQEDQHHQHHEDNSQHQGELHVAHGRTDRGPVAHDGELDRRRHGVLQARQLALRSAVRCR